MIKQAIEWLEMQGLSEVAVAALIAFAFSWLTAKSARLFLSDDDKDSIALWFMGAVDEKHWSTSFNQLFDSLFGKKHLSLNCFIRSAIASVIVVAILYLILGQQERLGADDLPFWMFLAGALVINAIADYISLLETRWMLRAISDLSGKIPLITVRVLIIDFVLTGLIIWAVIWLAQFLPLYTGERHSFAEVIAAFSPLSVFFYSTFLTSFWIWLYTLSLWILKVFRRFRLSEKVFRGAESNPISTLSVLVFLVSFSTVSGGQSVLEKNSNGGLMVDTTICNFFSGRVCARAMEFAEDEQSQQDYLLKACEGGELTNDCYELANEIYANDLELANLLYTKACDGGNDGGCLSLGMSYENGQGFEIDEAYAASLYQKACDLGGALACGILANLYFEGRGVAKNYHAAASLFTKACLAGVVMHCSTLGKTLVSIKEFIEKLPEFISNAPSMTCDRHREKICYDYKTIFSYLNRFLKPFKKGCEVGDIKYCEALRIIELELRLGSVILSPSLSK